MKRSQIAVSPCSNPEMELGAVLQAYSSIGYRKFEVFTSWAKSAFGASAYPARYLGKAREREMTFSSFHLPAVLAENVEATLEAALLAARFAAALEAPIVLFKASDRPTYIQAAPMFLDRLEARGLAGRITPVLQNHFGTPISSLDDFREVIEGIDDKRMRTLLEVGHFHSAGVGWREGVELLGDSIALIHVKDQTGPQSVPFGKGEIDLAGLVDFMDAREYGGDYVVEMEVEDKENTLEYLGEAFEYMNQLCREDAT